MKQIVFSPSFQPPSPHHADFSVFFWESYKQSRSVVQCLIILENPRHPLRNLTSWVTRWNTSSWFSVWDEVKKITGRLFGLGCVWFKYETLSQSFWSGLTCSKFSAFVNGLKEAVKLFQLTTWIILARKTRGCRKEGSSDLKMKFRFMSVRTNIHKCRKMTSWLSVMPHQHFAIVSKAEH